MTLSITTGNLITDRRLAFFFQNRLSFLTPSFFRDSSTAKFFETCYFKGPVKEAVSLC